MHHNFAGLHRCRDRGITKWQGFFMTEHNGELRKFALDLNNRDQPILTDERRDELDALIKEAMAYDNPCVVTHFSRGTYRESHGKIDRVDPLAGTLYINGEAIELERIIDVKIRDAD